MKLSRRVKHAKRIKHTKRVKYTRHTKNGGKQYKHKRTYRKHLRKLKHKSRLQKGGVDPQTDFTFYGKEYAFSLPKFPVELAQISTRLYYKKSERTGFFKTFKSADELLHQEFNVIVQLMCHAKLSDNIGLFLYNVKMNNIDTQKTHISLEFYVFVDDGSKETTPTTEQILELNQIYYWDSLDPISKKAILSEPTLQNVLKRYSNSLPTFANGLKLVPAKLSEKLPKNFTFPVDSNTNFSKIVKLLSNLRQIGNLKIKEEQQQRQQRQRQQRQQQQPQQQPQQQQQQQQQPQQQQPKQQQPQQQQPQQQQPQQQQQQQQGETPVNQFSEESRNKLLDEMTRSNGLIVAQFKKYETLIDEAKNQKILEMLRKGQLSHDDQETKKNEISRTAEDAINSFFEYIRYKTSSNDDDSATFEKKMTEFERKRKELEEKLQRDNYKIDFDAQLDSVTEPTQRKPVIIGTDYQGNDIYDINPDRLTNYTSRGRPDTGLHDHLIT